MVKGETGSFNCQVCGSALENENCIEEEGKILVRTVT